MQIEILHNVIPILKFLSFKVCIKLNCSKHIMNPYKEKRNRNNLDLNKKLFQQTFK